ncbi:ERI1 exoribonuclease 2 [Pseudolycoriella hygida]|uniref:ERI1 exoribonuclease 2 n=1 Tax=Pseudolycoriella hygida TaxID=35572 RepID=A0A9Q0NHG5_9DIPT|nr:ERI1 exoribonuclease 2 [Pseudolycoriella hygida]
MAYLIALHIQTTNFPSKESLKNGWEREIIDFGACLIDRTTGKTLENFHSFVKPTEFPITYGCYKSTNVSNKTVANSPPLACMLSSFQQWMSEIRKDYDLILPQCGLSQKENTYFCTWSNRDLGSYLRKECARKQITYAKYLRYWLNAQEMYSKAYNQQAPERFLDAVNYRIVGKRRILHNVVILAVFSNQLFHRNSRVDLKYCHF